MWSRCLDLGLHELCLAATDFTFSIFQYYSGSIQHTESKVSSGEISLIFGNLLKPSPVYVIGPGWPFLDWTNPYPLSHDAATGGSREWVPVFLSGAKIWLSHKLDPQIQNARPHDGWLPCCINKISTHANFWLKHVAGRTLHCKSKRWVRPAIHHAMKRTSIYDCALRLGVKETGKVDIVCAVPKRQWMLLHEVRFPSKL